MGYIYKTTNLINNKKYIGKSNGNKPNYLGSGILLKQAIRKYGKSNFKKEILYTSDSEEDLRIMEKHYIELENAVENSNYYNLHDGGQGGDTGFKDDTCMSAVVKKYWSNLSEEEYKIRCENQGKYDKSGSKNPKAKIAIVNGKEYECLKKALEDFDIPYSTLKRAAQTQKFNNKYNISAQYI